METTTSLLSEDFSLHVWMRDRDSYKPVKRFELNNRNYTDMTSDDIGMFITNKNAENTVSWIKFWDENITGGFQIVVLNSRQLMDDIIDNVISRGGMIRLLRNREKTFTLLNQAESKWGDNTIFVMPLALKNLRRSLRISERKLVHLCVIDPWAKLHTYKGKTVGRYHAEHSFTHHIIGIVWEYSDKSAKAGLSLISNYKPKELWTDSIAQQYGLNAWRYFDLNEFTQLKYSRYHNSSAPRLNSVNNEHSRHFSISL